MLKKLVSLTLSALLVLTACIVAPVTASAGDRLTLTQDFAEGNYAGGSYDVTNAEVAETPMMQTIKRCILNRIVLLPVMPGHGYLAMEIRKNPLKPALLTA